MNHTVSRIITIALLAVALSGCTSTTTVSQEGSSTVLPLAEVWAEEFGLQTGTIINVAGGGSGHGASSLCAGRLDLGDMSRAMKDSEKETCRANGIEPVEWKVAFDGLSVVVNKGNNYATDFSVDQLFQIFTGDAAKWTDVTPAIPGAPAATINLCIPDNESGTYEYFFEEILEANDEAATFASKAQQSADDNILVSCVANDNNAVGFFGFAYVASNSDKVKTVAVEGVQPTATTIEDASYSPLSRPLYIYTASDIQGPTYDYIHYILTDGQDLVPEVGYVKLSATVQSAMVDQLMAL
jgi:phosphate transport system substrate-binding protein